MKRRRCIQSTARPDAGPLTRLAGRKAKSAASLSEDKSPIEGKGASPSEKSHQNTTRIVAVESQRNDGVRRLSPEKSPSTSVNRESSDPEKQQMKINEMFRSICELKDQPPKKMKKRKIDDLPAVPEPQLKSISEYEGTVTKPSFSLPKSAHTVDREVFDVECAAETRIGGRHVNQVRKLQHRALLYSHPLSRTRIGLIKNMMQPKPVHTFKKQSLLYRHRQRASQFMACSMVMEGKGTSLHKYVMLNV